MFTIDTEIGFRDVVFITSSYGLGETVVQGAVNPGRVLRLQAVLADGKPAILRRSLGSKAIKMVFADAGAQAGKSAHAVKPSTRARAAQPLLAHRRRGRGARRATR